MELLETIVANQKKVLVFSQYRVEGTDKIADLLAQNQIGYVVYTGQTSPQQRERAVSDLRSKPEITVFLATTQTVGYGITLTEATYVIHFDHRWNPAKMQKDGLDIFDIKLARKVVNHGKLEQKTQTRRSAAKSFFQSNQNKLSPPTNSSHIIS